MTGTEPAGSPYKGHLLPPGSRPSVLDFAGLHAPDLVWDDERWLRFTERTDLHEVHYLEVHEDGTTVAMATLLLSPEAGGLLFYDPPRLAGTAGPMAEPELLEPADRQRWDALTSTLSDSRPDHYPSLALATFGSHHGVVHAPDRTAVQRRAVMAALPALLEQAAAELDCRSMALLYVGEPDAEAVDTAAAGAGYTAALLGADGVYELAADSWDEYIAGISGRRRSRLRKELRDYAAAGFRTVVREGPDAIDDDVVALQVAHRAKYGLPGGDDRVRRDFAAIREEIGDSCLLLGSERDGELQGFVLLLRTREALFARTVGFMPEAHGCYLALTYHETARWAVEHGIRRVHYGLAAYEAKFARGCELQPRWAWFAFPGERTDTFREVLTLQSRSIERRLALVGCPAVPVPSRRT
ncbi:GNAT family N-acetyltransferase [Umezawaea sp. Da 62-37]|uniref:GNAT family N-acetyltransferase n=1 Tax=Umezawaea sp. Da 62-37 TaxID=3075927 RepID=UPI0028F7227E|nr:GNAT family N-acetyltransferase [Umezawaea sp. Da 62-37]WNV84943.1 GNAT family N-acetyltransferase [Umezawaea sp. Da 62-37]